MKINNQTTASIDVDAQKAFSPLCPDELPVPDAEQIVPELNRQAQFARLRIGSKDAHSPQAIWVTNSQTPILTPLIGENVDCYWPLHAVPGTPGFELLPGLPQPKQYDFFVWKGIELDMHPYGACYHDHANRLSTGLIEYLRQEQIDTVIVGGLALDYCVKTTAMQLVQAGFNVLVNLAATRGIDKQSSYTAIEELKNNGVEFINSAAELTI
jgi:nicotinamidase/pyrazinamidase